MTNGLPCWSCRALNLPTVRFCAACGAPQDVSRAEPAALLDRFGAAFVDLTSWVATTAALRWAGLGWWSAILAWVLFVEVGYYLRGSLGKALFGLAIQVRGRGSHYLREIIGKLASLLTFGIGFLLVMSRDRLALHDHIARTRVVCLRPRPAIARTVAAFVLLLGIGLSTYVGTRLGLPKGSSLTPVTVSNSLETITQQIPSVLTLYTYDRGGKLSGLGSGFVVSPEGLATSNFHVLEKAYRAEVRLGDGRVFHVLRVHAFSRDEDWLLFQLMMFAE